MTESDRPRWVAVGEVARAHGIKGELKVHLLTDFPERYFATDSLHVAPPGREFAVEAVRPHGDALLVKLEGVDDRSAAERLRGGTLQVSESQLVPLADEEYYVFDIVGMTVETEDGRVLGTVASVLRTGANDVYAVDDGDGGEVLLPATHEVVRRIDTEAGRMLVRPLPGLLEDDTGAD